MCESSERQVEQFVPLWPGISRGGCVGVLRAVEDNQFACDDFGAGALLALAVLPGAIRESPLDEDSLALGHTLRCDLGQALVARNTVPVRGRGCSSSDGPIGGEAEGQDRLTVGERSELRRGAGPAYEDDSVKGKRHVLSSFCGMS